MEVGDIMKLLFSGLLLFLNMFTLMPLEMARPDPYGLVVYINNCTADESAFSGFDMPGHIDLLVEKSSYLGEINDQINERFKTVYPNYADYDFLDDGTFVSYFAYATSPSVYTKYDSDNQYGACYYTFARFETHKLGNIKLVYFDDAGAVLFESDVIEVTQPNRYQKGYTTLTFDYDTLTLENDIRVVLDTWIMVLVLVIFIVSVFYMVFIISIRFILLHLLHIHIKLTLKTFLLTCLVVLGYSVMFLLSYHLIMMRTGLKSLDIYYLLMGGYALFDLLITLYILKPSKIVAYILLMACLSAPLIYLFSKTVENLSI
jgi:hypothetical protein